MIWILNENFKKVDILRKYSFFQYEDKIREIGTFMIHLNVDKDNLFLLDKTKTYYVLFDEKHLGVIDKAVKDDDGEYEDTIVLTGRMALSVLNNRVINKMVDFKGNTSQYIKLLIENEFVNSLDERRINFNVLFDDEQEMIERSSELEQQVTGGYVFEEIQPYLEQDKLGIDIKPKVRTIFTPNGKDYETNIDEFDLVIMCGADRTKGNTKGNKPIIFSRTLNNIDRTSYTIDAEQMKDFAYIAGEGEDENRKWFAIQREDSEQKFGWNRKELWIDARDIQSEKEDGTKLTEEEYEQLIKQRADEKFSENDIVEEYTSTLILRNVKYAYGKDYYKGDFVTIVDDELDLTVDAQITGIVYSIGDNDELITDIELTYGSINKNVVDRTKMIETKLYSVSNEIKYISHKKDYEEGSSGSWTWKKHKDGTFDAWGYADFTGITVNTASMGTYYNNSSGSKTITLPFDFTPLSANVFSMEKQSRSSGMYIYDCVLSGKNLTVQFRAYASTSNGDCGGNFYIHGKWK